MKVAVVGDRLTVLGFSLAGVRLNHIVQNAQQAEKAIHELLADNNVGVILVSDRFGKEMVPFLAEFRRHKRVYPVIIEIPGPDGPHNKGDFFDRSLIPAVSTSKGGG